MHTYKDLGSIKSSTNKTSESIKSEFTCCSISFARALVIGPILISLELFTIGSSVYVGGVTVVGMSSSYYMEMELLLQRARVREEVEQTMQRFLHGLKFNIKCIVRHHTYYNMNDLLHLAREAESQLKEEAQKKSRYAPSSRFSPRTPSAAPMVSPSASNRSSTSY